MNYIVNASPITFVVLGALSIYFIAIIWIFIYRIISIRTILSNENKSLEIMLMGSASINSNSKLYSCFNRGNQITKELLQVCKNSKLKDSTIGLSFLSIVASTSPFIGLFGTVVSILETFSSFAEQAKISFQYLAPAIGEALVATAAGIFVAIFAYTFHQIIKREVFNLNFAMQTQIDLIISKNKE